MSTQQPSSASVQNAEQILGLVAAEASEAKREDLVARLSGARRLLVGSRVRVRVVGGPGQGKSALIEALMMAGSVDAPRGRHIRQVDFLEASFSTHSSGAPLGSDIVSAADTSAPAAVASAHAVLFVSDSSLPLSLVEIEQLRQCIDLCPMTVFVQTKIDSYAGWKIVLDQNIARMREAGLSVEAWALSSVGLMRGEWSRDDHLSAASGVPALSKELIQLGIDFQTTRLRVVAHHILAVMPQLQQMLRARQFDLADRAATDDLRGQRDLLLDRLQLLRERAVRWPALLGNGFASVQADSAFDLRRRVEVVRAHLDEALGNRKPLEHWEELVGWLQQRMSFEAAGNGQFAFAASEQLSQTAAEHFGIEEPSPLRPYTDQSLEPIPAIPPSIPRDRTIWLSAAVNIVSRSWMGFMMYYLIAGMAHVQLSAWWGFVPAGLLAATAVLDERKQWLSRERAAAAGALHKHVDVATVKASNEISETLRQLEQQMRESYGAYIDSQETALTKELGTIQFTLTQLEDAPAHIKEIDSGLAYYDQLTHRASTLVAAHMLEVANQAHA